MRLSLIAALAILACVPKGALAQTATTDAIATKVKSGDTVHVLDHESREITGVFGKRSDSAITLLVNGELRDIPFSEVRRIMRRGGDSIWNGVAIGAGVGLLAGAASQGLAVGLGGAVIYGAIGGIIDWAVQGRVEVYSAPGTRKSVSLGPLVGRGQRGVRVSVTF
jgi:hypothetical protein